MNYKVANKEVCKGMIDGEYIRGYDIDEKTVFVTVDGYCAFIIPKAEIIYDQSKVREMKKLFDFSDYIKPGNEIKATMNYFRFGKEYCRRFDGKNWYAFVQEKFLKKLDKDETYCFFQNYGKSKDMRKQSILATVKVYKKNSDDFEYIPVMLFLPITIMDYEKEK